MQKLKKVIHSVVLSPKLKIIFLENNDNIIKRDFIIQSEDHDSWKPTQYKSFFYIEEFTIYQKKEIIEQWLLGKITNEEFRAHVS